MCYIIFTSGSTGRPKGAVLQHDGSVNFMHFIHRCAHARAAGQAPARVCMAGLLSWMRSLRRGRAGRDAEVGAGVRARRMGWGEGVMLQKASASFDQSIAVRSIAPPRSAACTTRAGMQACAASAVCKDTGCPLQEIFGVFAGGGRLVIVPPGGEKDTQHMARLCKRHGVTSIAMVPSLLEALLRVRPTRLSMFGRVAACLPVTGLGCGGAQEPDFSACTALRTVVVGGETLRMPLMKLFRTLLPHAHLHNDYGPTEVTIGSTGRLSLASPCGPSVGACVAALSGWLALPCRL
jgi:acyl-coenzyme A synthetase/AMP-(fatty) acid ligase